LWQRCRNRRLLTPLTRQQGKISAAIAAEVNRGELHGFYVKRSEHGGVGEFESMSIEELEAYLNEPPTHEPQTHKGTGAKH
jgi:hypothetical protein